MFLVVLLLSIFVFVRTIGYAIYEYRENFNKSGAIIIWVLAVIALFSPIVVTLI